MARGCFRFSQRIALGYWSISKHAAVEIDCFCKRTIKCGFAMRSGVVFPRSGESNRKQSRCCHILALYNDYSFIINALIRPIFKYQVPHGTYGKSHTLCPVIYFSGKNCPFACQTSLESSLSPLSIAVPEKEIHRADFEKIAI